MSRAYSEDLRVRLVLMVDEGRSARSAAKLLRVSASSAVKWVQRWRREGSVAPSAVRGHRRSVFEGHEEWLLALVREQPDMTLEEIRGALARRGVGAGLSTIWAFFDRQRISFKKKPARQRARSCGRGSRSHPLAKRTTKP